MAKKVFSFLLALTLMLSLISCDDNVQPVIPTPTPTRTAAERITTNFIDRQNSSYGSVTVTNTALITDEATLEAFPTEDCGFIGCSTDKSGETIVSYYNPYTITVMEEITLYPVFIRNEQEIQFKNQEIEGAAINESWDDDNIFTYAELQNISDLTVNHPDALDDLAYFYNLKGLTIYLDSSIDYDFSPLAALENLSRLEFYFAPVDMLPIENYKNLRSLHIHYTGETISKPIKAAETLTKLELYDSGAEDYQIISMFPNITNLSLTASRDIGSAFSYLPDTVKKLYIDNCAGTDSMQALSEHPNLEYIIFENCTIFENTLSYLPKSITTLSIDACGTVQGITHLSEYPNLDFFKIEDGAFDVTELYTFPTNLNQLILRRCAHFTDTGFLSRLSNLWYLEFSNCGIRDISPVSNLKNLEQLYLYSNLITELPSFSALRNLHTLEFPGNRITDISPLATLQKNIYPDMRLNPITDYSILGDSHTYSQIAAVAQDIVDSAITSKMTDEEKYLALATALCEYVTYYNDTLSGVPINYCSESDIYCALITKEASCEGYAEAYMMLCTFADLPCYYVIGYNPLGSGHSWNIVEVDGHYYHVDTMHMDINKDQALFLKSDAFITEQGYRITWNADPSLLCDDQSKD